MGDKIIINFKSKPGESLLKVLVENFVISGGGEARRLFAMNGIIVNGEYENDKNRVITEEDFINGFMTVEVGRKKMVRIGKN